MTFKWTEEEFKQLQARRVRPRLKMTDAPVDQLRATLPTPKGRSKYRVRASDAEGVFYASDSEKRRHLELILLQRGGEIRNLRRQVGYELAPGVQLSFRDNRSPPLRYTADFVYDEVEDDGEWSTVVEDVKPQGTTDKELERDFVMRAHLMKHIHGLDIRIVRMGK